MHPLRNKYPRLTALAAVAAIGLLSHPINVVAASEAEIQTTIDTSSKLANEQNLLKLRQAVTTDNVALIANLLEELEGSDHLQTLFEIAKIRLDQTNPFYDEALGIGLINLVHNTGTKTIAGQAALLAGLHYKTSQYITDAEQAINWLEKAASLDVHRSHLYLGDLYSSDTIEEPNFVKALHHYEKYARKGAVAPLMAFARKIAQHIADGKECSIDPFEIAQVHLPTLFNEAASGKISAAKELGRLYLQGKLVQKDANLAAQWLQRAAQAGDAGALRDIARIQLLKDGSSTARAGAIALLEISGAKGNGAAYATLAKIYLNTNQTHTDELALKMYQKSIDAGYFGGLRELSKIYEGELLLGKHPKRIKRLSDMIYKISSKVAGYSPPSQDRGIGPNSNGLGIDTVVVGSVEGQNLNFGLETFRTRACVFQR